MTDQPSKLQSDACLQLKIDWKITQLTSMDIDGWMHLCLSRKPTIYPFWAAALLGDKVLKPSQPDDRPSHPCLRPRYPGHSAWPQAKPARPRQLARGPCQPGLRPRHPLVDIMSWFTIFCLYNWILFQHINLYDSIRFFHLRSQNVITVMAGLVGLMQGRRWKDESPCRQRLISPTSWWLSKISARCDQWSGCAENSRLTI